MSHSPSCTYALKMADLPVSFFHSSYGDCGLVWKGLPAGLPPADEGLRGVLLGRLLRWPPHDLFKLSFHLGIGVLGLLGLHLFLFCRFLSISLLEFGRGYSKCEVFRIDLLYLRFEETLQVAALPQESILEYLHHLNNFPSGYVAFRDANGSLAILNSMFSEANGNSLGSFFTVH